MDYFRYIMEIVGTGVDGMGVFVIIGGALFATVGLILRGLRNTGNYYALYRQDVGRAILLGLEFLIAGDIIRTVVVAPTIQNVLALGLIVLIRTFLSLSLQLEIEGKCRGAVKYRAKITSLKAFPSRSKLQPHQYCLRRLSGVFLD
jgi:uncharacterized membrane protein